MGWAKRMGSRLNNLTFQSVGAQTRVGPTFAEGQRERLYRYLSASAAWAAARRAMGTRNGLQLT